MGKPRHIMLDEHGGKLLDAIRSRRDILRSLNLGPRTKPELVDECDVSRSTIDRGIGTLEDVGVVVRTDGRYKLTLFGRVVFRDFGLMLERLNRLSRVRHFINDIDGHADVDADLFDRAEIQLSKGLSIAPVPDTFREASELRIVDPPFFLVVLGLASESGPPIDGTVTVFLRSEVLAEVVSYNPSLIETYIGREIALYELSDPPPFSFALLERSTHDSVCLILGNRREGLAIIENQAPDAVTWGEALFEETTDTARQVGVKSITN